MLGWSTQLGNKLFGPDPKLEFRKPGQGLDLLAGPTIPIDAPYWNHFLTVFDSPSDLPHLLPSQALLNALHRNPLNVLTLVHLASSTLFRLLATPDFPHAPEHAREALNAVRVLTRVVPLLLAPRGVDAEGFAAVDAVEDELFWRRERVPVAREIGEEQIGAAQTGAGAAAGTEDGQFVLEDDDEEDRAAAADPLSSSTPTASSSAAPRAQEPAYDELPPLAVRLLGALVDLLFVPSFTIAESLAAPQEVGHEGRNVVTYAIWEPGIASSTPSPPLPISHLTARVEILRLLTLLISLPSLLTPPHLFPTLPNRWRDALVSGLAAGHGDRNVVLCLLCSTLNVALNAGVAASAAGADGETLRARAARLAADTARRSGASPSTAVLGGDQASARQALVGASLHLLGAVLLEHAPPADSPSNSPTDADPASSSSSSSTKSPNLFAFYLSRLHRPADLSFLVSGTLGLVESALAAPPAGGLFAGAAAAVAGSAGLTAGGQNNGGGDARRDPAWATEALVLLTRAWALNKKLVAHVARDVGSVPRLVGALEACALEWREDDAALGLVRAASFALQSVSAEVGGAALTRGHEGREELARVLSAPMGVELVGARLAGVVRRLVAAQGVELQAEGGRERKGEDKDVSCAEFISISLHAVLLPSPHVPAHAPSRTALSTLYPSRLLLLSNLSPFVRDLGHDAATRLVRVWLAFSAPSWVMMEEGNPRLMFYLLETFNNIVNLHLDSNPHLLYALTITLKRLELLSNFTLAQGIAEARRLRAARRDRQAGRALSSISEGSAASSTPSSSSTVPPLASVAAGTADGDGDVDGASEVVRGKRPERALSISSVADLSLTGSPSLGAGAGSSRASLALYEDEAAGERPFVGKNGFVPSEDWVASWRDGLPLDTLLVLLSELRPLLAEHDPSFPSTSAPPSSATIAHLRTLLVSPLLTALLPPSSTRAEPKMRPWVGSPAATTWLASLLYGRLYLAILAYVRDTLPVQLFAVASAPSAASGGRARAGLVAGLSDGLGAEMERVGRSAAQVGGRVGGAVRGVLGRFGGGGTASGR
ncbi:hypothetical protein JCM8208_001471 [Rhodotorula glutinis]